MSLDVYAVGTALAATFGTVTAPANTMGGTVIRGYSLELNAVPVTPYVVVELPKGEITFDPSRLLVEHDFPVYFLFQKASADLPRDMAAMLQWLGPLLSATYGKMKLGLTDVRKSYVTAYGFGTYKYEGDEYHAWHLTAKVWTEDAVTVTP